jgi:hypothetical protein
MQKITDATGAPNDGFAFSVSISGNYAIAGAYTDDGAIGADQGSASVYKYDGTEWLLMQKLTDASGAAGDWFGYCVSISGNYAIVGSPLSNVGGQYRPGCCQYLSIRWQQLGIDEKTC